jgi:protein translocase SecG subunit
MIAIVQIVLAVVIIGLILLQERSSGMSGLFGGGGDDSYYQPRRGMEKFVFIATIVASVIFVALAAWQLVRGMK